MHLIRNQAYSQGYRGFESLSLRHRARPRARRAVVYFGEMTERPKVHDWKSCIPQGIGGSNPPLSASRRAPERAVNKITIYGPG